MSGKVRARPGENRVRKLPCGFFALKTIPVAPGSSKDTSRESAMKSM